jgi:hypothetical protein
MREKLIKGRTFSGPNGRKQNAQWYKSTEKNHSKINANFIIYPVPNHIMAKNCRIVPYKRVDCFKSCMKK